MNRLAYASIALLAACGADPISYSSPVGINVKAKSGDVVTAAISESKAITTESGNPYGAFINDATAKLKHAPGRVDLSLVTLELGADSKNVAALESVFTGEVDVAFIVDDSNNTYYVAKGMNPTGVGPDKVALTSFDGTVVEQDTAKYLGGGFKVSVSGTAAPGFAAAGAEASLQLTFTFAAFE